MPVPGSELGAFYARWNPVVSATLSASSTEALSLDELLALADAEAKRLWDRCELSYAWSRGHGALRAEIAALYDGVSPDGVVTFAGAQEAIYCALRGLLDAGDHVVVVTPCYDALLSIPRMIGAAVTEVSLVEEEGWQLSLERLDDAVRPDTRMIVINFPHNPTGAVLREGELAQIAAIAARSGAWLFSDEVFRQLDDRGLESAPTAASLYDRAVSLDVLSKAWGLGGVRVGWLATRDERALQAAEDVKGWTSICNGAADEILALIAIRARESILPPNRRRNGAHRARLDAFFARHSDRLSWRRPQTGCLAFPRWRGASSIDGLSRSLAEERGLLMIPGRLFHAAGPYFRIGYGLASFPDALARLEQHLDAI